MRAFRGVCGPLVGSFLLSSWLGGCTELQLGAESQEVIGGEVTLEGEFPGVGALMYDFGDGKPLAGCTGTLIAPNAVLTAAHCLDPEVTGDIMPGFTLALNTIVATPIVVGGLTKHKHEMFSIQADIGEGLGTFYDVGVLILKEPITTVAPMKMARPIDSAELVADLDLEIAGYGKITPSNDETGVMYDAMTKLVSMNATEIQVGMGSPQPQNCNGDSGGPGFARVGGSRRVVGIVSRSFQGFECTSGGVDTRVDAYLPWIHGKVPTGIPCSSGMSEECPTMGDDDDEGGCCSTSSSTVPSSGAFALALGWMLLRPRRRR